VQKILGNTDLKSTMRCAHIGEDSTAEAVRAIADMLETRSSAQAAPVEKRKRSA
jgi:hypothetical protein